MILEAKNSVKKAVKNEQKNAISDAEIQSIGALILETIVADEMNAMVQLQNYYQVYLRLEKEGDKAQYLKGAELACNAGGIALTTWLKKRSVFNVAISQGVDVSLFASEKALQNSNKAIKLGDKKVLKNGTVKTDVKGAAKNVAEKIEIQAVNQNELVELLSATWFKNAMKDIEKSGVSKAVFMKGWAQSQSKNA